MQEWADAIHDAGAPAPRCIGFIDGTFRPHTRPGRGQRQCYSGYKKLHGIKFQSVVSANGLIVDFFGCVVGRRGDGYMLGASGFLARMAALVATEGQPFYVYGDPAYSLSQFILRGFKGAMTPAQQAFSTDMSRVRETVEWGFELIVRDWAFVDFCKNLKIHKQPIGRLYFVAALLTNMKTCVMAAHTFDYFGNQISQAFGVSPPSLHNYLYA
uniref:DDE Tnp4 domain-containing protein n=1 Tax=Haptolina brevifila TaxID=156173 RepID=A0A6U7DUP4_9EUKA|mmetsp:Transcript_29391/g.59180  ORF Transcript_29391/g.59180 Transcript_29391/m.59180 type:complete len:213 (+) Transcript_29391:638-1276(+)